MSAPDPTVHRHEVVVVGSGFSGLAQVRELRAGGIDDVVVLEKAEALGGTRASLADDHDLRSHVRFGREVTGAGWDEESRTWTVRTHGRDGEDGDVRVCRHLVAGLDVAGIDITGRAGRTLRGTWAEHGMATHLGITVSDFPNLFLLGPDTGLGHDAAVLMIECRTRYVRRAIETVRALGMSGLDVRAEVQQRSTAAARRRRAASPQMFLRSWFETRRFEPEDFEFFGRAADAARAGSGPDGHGGRVSRVTPTDQALLHDGGDEDAVAPVEPAAGEAAPTSGVG